MDQRGSLDKLFQVVAETLNVPKHELSRDSRRDSIKEWDSLGHIMLILAIEREFHFKFSIEQIDRIKTIAEIIACVLPEISAEI